MDQTIPISLLKTEHISEKLGKVKLLLLDVDGVLTSGYKTYSETGLCTHKEFADIDFTAIKRFKASGVHVALLSGDEFINKSIASNRNLPFWFTRGKPKSEFFDEVYSYFNINLSTISAFVGDDIFDLCAMKASTIPVCPANSCIDVQKYCSNEENGINLVRNGGKGCIDELYYYYVNSNGINASIEKVYNLDSDEKF